MISTALGSILGVLGAIYKGSIGDNVLTVAGMIGVSIPQFFFGVCAILIFALNLGWLPVGGRTDTNAVTFLDRAKYMVLPALVLGVSMTAGVMRYARSIMLVMEGKSDTWIQGVSYACNCINWFPPANADRRFRSN